MTKNKGGFRVKTPRGFQVGKKDKAGSATRPPEDLISPAGSRWGDEAHKPAYWLDQPRKPILKRKEDRQDHKYMQRDLIIKSIIEGNNIYPQNPIKPLDVENSIRGKLGLECWYAGNKNDNEAIASERWLWEVAVCWIAWQSIEGLQAGLAAFYAWKGQIRFDDCRLGQVMSFARAERFLRLSLEAGHLRAWKSIVNGAEAIPPEAWRHHEWKLEHPPVLLRAKVLGLAWTVDGPVLPPEPETDAPDVAEAPAAEIEVDQQMKNIARTAPARAMKSAHARARLEALRPHIGLLDEPGGRRKLRKLSDEFQKSKDKKPLSDTGFDNDLAALRSTEMEPISVPNDRSDRTTEV